MALGQWGLFYKGLAGVTANRPPLDVFKSMTAGLSRESGAGNSCKGIFFFPVVDSTFYCMIYLRWGKFNVELLLIGVRLLNQFHVPCTNHNLSLKCYYISPMTQGETANHFKDLLWSHTLETFMTARRSRQHPCYSPILLSYCCNYTKSLVIPSKGMQLWLKINFRDIRKKKKKK